MCVRQELFILASEHEGLKAINPGGIYIRHNYYLQYYNDSDLIGSYIHLAEREGLPPLYLSLNPRAGVDVAAEQFEQHRAAAVDTRRQHQRRVRDGVRRA